MLLGSLVNHERALSEPWHGDRLKRRLKNDRLIKSGSMAGWMLAVCRP